MTAKALIIAHRLMLHVIKDRRSLGMILIMPIMISIVFGYAISGKVENAPIDIINLDQSSIEGEAEVQGVTQNITINIGDRISGFLELDKRVDVHYSDDIDASKDRVESGKRTSYILFTVNFTQNMFNPTITNVSLIVFNDPTEPNVRREVLVALRDAFSALRESAGIDLPISIAEEYAFEGAEFSSFDIAVPSIIGFIISYLIFFFSVIFAIKELLLGTRRRMFMTPIRHRDATLGFGLTLSIVAIIMVISTLVIEMVIFNVKVQGNIPLLLVAGFIFGLTFVFMGIFISNFATNELQAVQFVPLLTMPQLALSGFMVPVDSLPEWLQPVSLALPLTYGIEIFRGIMLKGYGIVDLWVEFLAIIAFSLFFLILSTVVSREG
ncbi:MAG: ABC transporter permease [Candidatus Kariarchaeaceae archaeon]